MNLYKAYIFGYSWVKTFIIVSIFTVALYVTTGWVFYFVLTLLGLWLFAMIWTLHWIDNFDMGMISKDLYDNKEYMQQAMEEYIGNFLYSSYRLRSDKNFVLSAFDCAPADIGGAIISLKDISNELRDDPEIVTKALILNGCNLKYVSDRCHKEKEYVLMAVKSSGYALEYATDIFRSDPEVVMEAIKRHGAAMEFAVEKLKTDKEFALKGIKLGSGAVFEHISKRLKDDYDVAVAAVRDMNIALEYASTRLKKDESIVLAAIGKDLRALEYISDEYVASEKFLQVLFDDGSDRPFISLMSDKKTVIKALKSSGLILRYAPAEFRADKDIVKLAYLECRDALQYATKKLLDDKTFIMEILSEKVGGLKYASETLRADKDIARLEMSSMNHGKYDGYRNFKYISDELRADREIAKAAVYYPGNLAFAPQEKRDDKEIVEVALLASRGEDFKYASDRLQRDKIYILKCLKSISTSYNMYRYIADELKNDKQLAIAAINKSVDNANFIGALLKDDMEIIELVKKKNRSALSS